MHAATATTAITLTTARIGTRRIGGLPETVRLPSAREQATGLRRVLLPAPLSACHDGTLSLMLVNG
jgi:hypothetical protein